jgi:tripartite-type tricarboxylate transporter receptor subunit TctC
MQNCSHRRRALMLAVLAAITAPCAVAQPSGLYPEKPIKWIVPAAAGGAADSAVRIVAEELARRLGQPVVIENRPGASGAIGLDAIAKAAPDGYTIGTGNFANFVMNPVVRPQFPFDPDRDLQPVVKLTSQPNVLAVTPSLPATTLPQLIAHLKANPGRFNYASSGSGSSLHVAAELFKAMTGTDLVHVPYKSTPAANTDLIAGNVQLMIDNLSTIAPHVKAGRVRALAVTTARRSHVLPEVPTMAEAGLAGYEMTVWGGVVAPAKVPKAVIDKLSAEILAILATPIVQRQLGELGFAVEAVGPGPFGEEIRRERAKWREVVRRAGIQAD